MAGNFTLGKREKFRVKIETVDVLLSSPTHSPSALFFLYFIMYVFFYIEKELDYKFLFAVIDCNC